MEKGISELLSSAEILEGKRIEQIVGICGNETLSDGSKCSKEFQEFLQNVPSRLLHRYAEQCLESAPRNANTGLIDISKYSL